MEALRIKCPSCGIVLEVKNSKNEKVKTITCPNCQKQLAITFGDMSVPIGSLYGDSTRYQLNEGANVIPGIPSGIVELRVVRLKNGTSKHILRVLTGEQKAEVNGHSLMQGDEVVLQQGDELSIGGKAFCFEKSQTDHADRSSEHEQECQSTPISPEPQTKTKESKSSRFKWSVVALILTLFVLFIMYFWPTRSVQPFTGKTKASQESVITNTKTAIKESKKTFKPQIQKQPKTSEKIDLGYAIWDGKSVKGNPDGYGTMTYRSAHLIDSRDDQGRIARPGDKVKGNYIGGHLEYGTWIKSDGSKEEIFIGQ